MKRVVNFELEGGGFIAVEVDEPEERADFVPASRKTRRPEAVGKAKVKFQVALDKVIRPAATAILAELRDLPNPPDEVAAEFGVSMNSTLGAILASAGMGATFTVTLTWKRKDQEGTGQG